LPVTSETLGTDPLSVFEAWYAEACTRETPFADAMTLATATADGRPSARMVLYKGLLDGGLCFVTNYASRKGEQLAQNPYAALVFFWATLNRQVRFEGRAEAAPAAWSDRYFGARARASQIGAWASAQSRAIDSRAALERKITQVEERFAGRAVERPSFWGGFRLVPERIEFWLGQDARLHDRFCYDRAAADWHCQRLSP
jgi:pyridoxamine 5'-phosphate oxidase